MSRNSILTAAVLLVMVALVAMPAAARTQAPSSTAKVVYHSYQCKAAIAKYDAGTWACTTITVQPWQVNAAAKTTATFQFRAKKDLKYVSVCFSQICTDKCAFQHRYTTLLRGHSVNKTLKLKAPSVTATGTFPLDNYSRFYKPPKYISRETYWVARSTVCVVAAEEPSSRCSVGRSG